MLSRLIKGLVEIIYPKICLSCKNKLGASSIENFICAGCWAKIKKNPPPFCRVCGRHLEKPGFANNICPQCVKTRFYFDRAFSPCVYTGIIRDLIHEFKYKNKDYLGSSLSSLMTEFIREYNLPIDRLDLIIPVPLHKIRLREREFNQAEILSRHIAEEFKKDISTDILQRRRHTKTQTRLETNERLLNVRGTFSVIKNRGLSGKNVLLVDDVFTSGATSSEASFALKEAGANMVFVLTLAN